MNPRQGKKRRFQVEALEGRIALGAVAPGVGLAPPAHVQTAATSVQPAATSGPVLRRGSRGEFVRILQTDLQKLGLGSYLGTTGPHHDGVDGIFGPRTENAVRQFQIRYNHVLDVLHYPPSKHILVDGIVGPQTWTALNDVLPGSVSV